jgi:hypothetical protein
MIPLFPAQMLSQELRRLHDQQPYDMRTPESEARLHAAPVDRLSTTMRLDLP